MIGNVLSFCHSVLEEKVAQAQVLVDATAGNGIDTLFLARFSPDHAQVISFDIQPCAVERTRQLLRENQVLNKVNIIQDSHEKIGQYVTGIDIACFNLGYLPKGDHSITTKAESTVSAVEALLPLLNPGALVSLIAYPGHSEGLREQAALEYFLTTLPQQDYHVGCWQMLNQVHCPPILYLIEKK